MQGIPPGYRLPSEDLLARARGLLAVREETRCAPSTAEEIVVCARVEDEERLRLIDPAVPPPKLSEQIGEALSFKIGPVEVGSIPLDNGTRALGLRLKF